MERFLQKHLASVIATLAASGIIGGITVTMQNRTDNELTRQRISQLEFVIQDLSRRLEKMQETLTDGSLRLRVAVIEARLEEVEKKIDKKSN